MGTNRMRNIDKHVPDVLCVAGGADIRQIRRAKRRRESLFSGWRAWSMRMHYGMWVVIAVAFMIGGMLFRGQQDIIIKDAMAAAQMETLSAIPVGILGKISTEHEI